MSGDLHSKTVRPGSLNGYSYYHSGQAPSAPATKTPSKRISAKTIALIVVVAVFFGIGMAVRANEGATTADISTSNNQSSQPAKQTPAATPVNKKINNQCANNDLAKFIKVDISQRHLWACEKTKLVKQSPVITGLESLASNKTPRGTFTIYGKMADTRLRGTDERGAWDYPVSYWLPYLDNQNGTYGFHDATWRADSSYGNIDPNSNEASRGCVELPLGTMKWLYDWADKGTPVTVVD